MNNRLCYAARLLVCLMFLESGIDKALHWQTYLAETTAKGIPLPALALAAALATELLGSIALITDIGLRFAAAALAAYIFAVNFFYFDFWNQEGIAAIMARKEFLKDLAVVGALCLLAHPASGKDAA